MSIFIGLIAHKMKFVNVSLILFCSFFSLAQASYNNCGLALEICPDYPTSINNIGANVTFCTPCDDNFNFCFTPNNTIWLKFRTNNVGGATQINFTNPVFETNPGQDNKIQALIIRANGPCDGTTYVSQGNCVMNATSNFSLNANLVANTLYYVVLNGSKSGAGITMAAEFTVDAELTGVGVERIIPILNLSAPTDLCKNEIANFTAHLSNCPDSGAYQWFINGNLVATTIDSNFQTTALSDGDVVTVSNDCFTQCRITKSTSTSNINVIEFLVDAGPDQNIPFNGSADLMGNTTGTSFVWSPNVFLSSTSIINPTVSPTTSMTYFLTAEKNGCFITDEVYITVGLDLEIFNTFSPNDDGKNDTWEIPGLINYPNCLVEIFDRWGQLVYSVTGYNEKKYWDGKKDGKKLTPGVYFYHIDLRDSDKNKLTGYLNLIR